MNVEGQLVTASPDVWKNRAEAWPSVALKYDSTQSEAPVVNAKGEDEVALRIRRIANENQIPVVENRPVARELYTNLEVGDIIPEKYFKVITLIYAQLDKYKNL